MLQWLCYKCMFQIFFLFQSYVTIFHLSLTKVDLNVGLLSTEERASARAIAASAVSWRQCSTGGRAGVRTGARDPFPYDMLPPLASPEEAEARGIFPCDGDTNPGYGGDTGTASGRAPLLRGRGGCSVSWRTRHGVAELRPDTGLGPNVWVLVIPLGEWNRSMCNDMAHH
jgi:hypothetical protein